MEKPTISKELLTASHWDERESQNAKLLGEFIQLLMNDHDFEAVRRQFKSYGVQHNRGIPDGLEGLVGYVENFVKRFPEYSYDVKKVIADGDHVVFHSHVTVKKSHRGNDKKGFNIIDAWRVENGTIAEHWDAIQPLDFFMRFYVWLVGGQMKNSNSVF